MSLFDILGTILIGPLKLIFEVIFSVAYKIIQHPGPAIIVLSLVMNILVLPLYRRADAIQIEARDTENKLRDVATHIKKTFSGDERMMILQTYYRQNHYNPLSVLSGSVSLLLEIPFFMAAYQFLSHVDAFQGVGFGPIADLSVPDGLIVIGGFTVNLLPVIMTVVNVVSSSLYLKGFPLKTKIQLYGMALFFLVFLYNSPAALVFYWTLNNLFSLVKTLFYRMKNPRKVLNVLLSAVGVIALVLGIVMRGFWRSSLMIAVGIVTQLPWLIPLVTKRFPRLTTSRKEQEPDKKLFILGAIFLSILVGLLIPSTFISASPQEYIDASYFYNPVWYVVYTACLAVGTFLVWFGVFYWLSNRKMKVLFSRLVWVLSIIMVVNYMFFGTNLGVLSPDLQYTDGFGFGLREHLINLAVVLVLACLLLLILKKFPKAVSAILLVASLALACMSGLNIVSIANAAQETKQQLASETNDMPSFNLSTEGQNVVVIMLDRAIGPFVPYLMEENPDLVEQFDGFTYYSNTLSYGPTTNFAAPALYGGYEYTPVNLNLRSDEKLVDKHNESLKVLPTLFAREDYDVTVIDPSYANYSWIPDISIYDDCPGVTAYLAEGKFDDVQTLINKVNVRRRNFFVFSLMKTLPVSLQDPLYNDGAYRTIPSSGRNDTLSVKPSFMMAYNVMNNMSTMANVVEGDENTFMFLRSNITHEPVVLQEPDFTPASVVDNSAYYPAEGKTITAGDSSYLLKNEYSLSHYHVNMRALMELGEWFDTLRQQGVYDNTRIIVAADHGRGINVFDEDEEGLQDIELYLPMLLVKDFNATGFTTNDTFMTNADVPTLAMEGLIEDPVNPFTGIPINSDAKDTAERHYVILSNDWNVADNNGNQFNAGLWASVSGNVTQKENWVYYPDITVMPPILEE